jgi:hypothetical protein
VAKARSAGVTTSDLLRDLLVQGRVFAKRMPTRSDALLLERLAVMLAVVAERSRAIADKEVALSIVVRLAVIESELITFRQEPIAP